MKTLSLFAVAAGLLLPALNTLAAAPRAVFENLPISFEANIGQANSAVRFLTHGENGNLLLTQNEVWLALRNGGTNDGSRLLRLKLDGANANPTLEGINPLPGKANYFTGGEAGQWRTDAPTFAGVKYHDVYPGVDLVYYGNQQKLEYDFMVAPGADASAILLEFAGAEKISLDRNGDLLLQVGGETVRQHKPIVYQEINGARKMLSGEYVLHSGMRAGFQIGEYDRSLPLVIDPVLGYSQAFGSSGTSQATAIALDVHGSIYVTGNTTGADFPLLNAYQTNFQGNGDVFVMKIDTNGTVIYSTYLGGGKLNNINQASSGQAIAVNLQGNAFVAGYTEVTNFPVFNAMQSTNGGICDAFVTELGSNGNTLVFSTYIGGEGIDQANGIALNTNNEPIITGHTQSAHFPVANASQPTYGGGGDAFVARLKNDGSGFIYSTYLGGNDSENNTAKSLNSFLSLALPGLGGAIAVDPLGNAFVTGWTYSTNFPVLHAFQATNSSRASTLYPNAFLTKLDPSGNLVYSTYFGDVGGNMARAIGLDFLDNVYIAGSDEGATLTVKYAYQPNFGGNGAAALGDGFVAAFDFTGTNLIYSTYLGGSGDDQINGLAVRFDDGLVAVTGFTDSKNFPTLDAVQSVGQQGLFKSVNSADDWNLSNSGIGSGVVYSIQIDPSNPSTVYALTSTGCFKSTDAGANWSSASSGIISVFGPSVMGSSSSQQMAIDPAHPNILYVSSINGIYQTTNSGANWNFISITNSSFLFFNIVAVDPKTPSTIYAGGTVGGILKSTNSGASWFFATNGLNNFQVLALAIDPQNPSTLYAGVNNFSGQSVFKSTNGGGNWALSSSGLVPEPATAFAFAPGNSSNVYAIVMSEINESSVLGFSTNAGATWSQIYQSGGEKFTTLVAGQAPAAQPTLSLIQFAGTEFVSWPASFNNYALQSSPSLQGAWTTVSQMPVSQNGQNLLPISTASGNLFYRLAQTGPSTSTSTVMYMGTDGLGNLGALESEDGGISWAASGPSGLFINALAVNPNDPTTAYLGASGGRDGFLTLLSPTGQLVSSTFIGGRGTDQENAVAIDETTTYLAGFTLSDDLTLNNGPLSAGKLGLLDKSGRTKGSPPGPPPTQAQVRTYDDHPCPDTETVMLPRAGDKPIHVGDFFYQPFHVVYDNQGHSFQSTGSLPGATVEDGALGFQSDFLSIQGALTTPGTFTISVNIKAANCDYTRTFIVTVLP